MVRGADPLDELRSLYDAAASAEEDAADALLPSLPVRRSGGPRAGVLLVKGEAGAEDVAEGNALAGPDGDAARAALEALGVPLDDGTLAVVTRPAPGTDPRLAGERLARYLEAADPALAVALDAVAAEDLALAAGLSALPFGKPALVHGRTLLAVDGLEASLGDEARKRRVWTQFKALETQQGRR